ncbi:TonB-dependent siderophore receptor [Luteitalea sp. TBR-22]|uniref:TonB-dependent siderophore receptor n=1 Tax=Luteitalea sp. TBR-22 TaxID=2802971 RepID=UPI001EF44CA3|nr:TonB-dependent receptor [Luteitalea sp. TBR-22]
MARQTQPPSAEPSSEASTTTIREVGGRLLLSDETVVVAPEPGAVVRDASIATKAESPILETPRSVTVVDRRTLDDLGALNLSQAHDYTVGLTPLDERGLAVARGFPIDFYDLRRDGLRTYAWSVREVAAVDRVQYLRGAASVLYGDGSPGALVNMVLKKPLPVGRREFSGTIGGAGLLRGTADVTGPIAASRRVRYRVIAAVEGLDNGFDNDERRISLLPTLAVDIGTTGSLTVDTEWYRQRGRAYRHLVPATPSAQRGDFSGYPWDLNVNAPEEGWVGSNLSPGVRYDVALGRSASLHAAGRYTRIDGDIEGQGLVGLSADGRTAQRIAYDEDSTWHEYQTDTFAVSTFTTGRLRHRLVTGLEAGLSTADRSIASGPATPLDVTMPSYPPQLAPPSRRSAYDIGRAGLYASDQVGVGGRVTLVPSIRWSRIAVDQRIADGQQASSADTVVSPGLGVVWLGRPWWSVYANASSGFEPPTPGQFDPDGRALAPARHALLEAGIKAEVGRRRLSVTAAGFHIRRTNVAEADGRGAFRQIGQAESRGVEVEALGALTSWLSVRSGYAWTATAITRDATGAEGNHLPNAPRHAAHAWITARLPWGQGRPLTVAGGVVAVSSRFTTRDNLIVAPAYRRLDASAWYRPGDSPVSVGVVAFNLANTRYVTSGAGATFVAAPLRRVSLQCTTTF